MADERHGVAFVVGATLGGVAGAVATLLNAPQAGVSTRTRIGERAGALLRQADEATRGLRADARRLGERVAAPVGARIGGGPTGAETTPLPVPDLPPMPPVPPVPPGAVSVPLPPERSYGATVATADDVVIDGPR